MSSTRAARPVQVTTFLFQGQGLPWGAHRWTKTCGDCREAESRPHESHPTGSHGPRVWPDTSHCSWAEERRKGEKRQQLSCYTLNLWVHGNPGRGNSNHLQPHSEPYPCTHPRVAQAIKERLLRQVRFIKGRKKWPEKRVRVEGNIRNMKHTQE